MQLTFTPEQRLLFDPLLKAAKAGDQNALAEAVRFVEHPLRRLIRVSIPASLRSIFDSVDVMQLTHIDVLEAFKDFKGDTADEFVKWLLPIAIHNCHDLRNYYRRQCRCAKCRQSIESSEALDAVAPA